MHRSCCPAGAVRRGVQLLKHGRFLSLAAALLMVLLGDTAGQLILVDPATAAIGSRWSVGSRSTLRDLVATPEGLWINDTDRDTVLWVDPDDPDRSEPLDATITGPRLLRSAGGAVWVHSAGSGEIIRIDPSARRVEARTPAEQINSYAIG